MRKNLLSKIAKASIIALPCSIFFSYHPLMYFGEDKLMHYELSVALIALVLFDIIAVLYLLKNRKTLKKAPKRFMILTALFPIYATLSVLWSSSKVHGFLAAGVVWAIYLAVNIQQQVYQNFLRRQHRVLRNLLAAMYPRFDGRQPRHHAHVRRLRLPYFRLPASKWLYG